VSFLGTASFATANVDGTTFAWTRSDGACETWAMHNTIAGYASQAPLTFGFASHSSFINAVCAMSPVPSTYFEASYVELANACSSITC
jgi:hypothetical protein